MIIESQLTKCLSNRILVGTCIPLMGKLDIASWLSISNSERWLIYCIRRIVSFSWNGMEDNNIANVFNFLTKMCNKAICFAQNSAIRYHVLGTFSRNTELFSLQQNSVTTISARNFLIRSVCKSEFGNM